MKKRIRFDIPYEAYMNLNKKRNVLQDIAKSEFKKDIKFTMTDTLRFFSSKPIYVYNEEVVNFLKLKRRGKRLT